jgi:hypothetical protein
VTSELSKQSWYKYLVLIKILPLVNVVEGTLIAQNLLSGNHLLEPSLQSTCQVMEDVSSDARLQPAVRPVLNPGSSVARNSQDV